MNGIARNYRAFIRSVLAGSLAAASPGLLFTVPLGLVMLFDFDDPNGGLQALPLLVSPLVVSLPCVLAASTVLGLPLTLLLSALGRERGELYVALGMLLGAGPFLLAAFIMEGGSAFGMIAVLGALGGGVAGWVWGRHRDDLSGRSPWD